jgi:hypothetical protein
MMEIKERGSGRIGFKVKVQPSSPESKLLGWNEAGELCVRVRARPREGKANRELINVLASTLGVARGELSIEAGDRSRVKIISAPRGVREILENFGPLDSSK